MNQNTIKSRFVKTAKSNHFSLSLIIIFSLLPLTALVGNAATEFKAILKSVAITDAAGTNSPPTAVIEYTKDGTIYTFDASMSSDQDGSIVSYSWDFGDGISSSEVNAKHQFSPGIKQVTLTVIDNKAAATITQTQVQIDEFGLELIPEGTFGSKDRLGDFKIEIYGSPVSIAMTNRTVTVEYDSRYDGFMISLDNVTKGDAFRLWYSYSGTSNFKIRSSSEKVNFNAYSNTNISDSSWIDFTSLATGVLPLYIYHDINTAGSFSVTISLKKIL